VGYLGRHELEEHDMWVRNLIFRQRTTCQRPFTWSDPDTRGKFWRMNDVRMLMFFQTSKRRRRVVPFVRGQTGMDGSSGSGARRKKMTFDVLETGLDPATVDS